jgi:hypothetical protein
MPAKDKKVFLVSVAYRYVGMVLAFALSVLIASSFLPYAVVLNPIFQMLMWVAAIVSIFIYVARSMKEQTRASKDKFLHEKGFYELLVGGTLGLALAGELIISAAIAPGAILFAATTVVALFTSILAYVAINKMLLPSHDLEREISATQKAGSGLLFLTFIVGLPVVALLVVSGIAGVSLFPFLLEITLAGVFGLMLLGNIYTVLHKQEVVILGSRYQDVTVKNNPMYCAIMLFANTIDLFRALVQAYMHLNNSTKDSDKVKISWKDVINTLLGVSIVVGVFYLICRAFQGTFSEPFDTSEHRNTTRESQDWRSAGGDCFATGHTPAKYGGSTWNANPDDRQATSHFSGASSW